jgi:outer membrane protein assembly factor BamB
VVPVGRGSDSLLALDGDLRPRWTRSYPRSTRIQGAPIIDGRTVYAGNAESFLSAIDLETGEPRWTTTLYSSWSMWNLGTPALAHGLLFVATPHVHLFAVDAATGEVKWKRGAGRGPIHPVAYWRRARGFLASPVVTGRLVWAGGIDGVLRAFDAASGEEEWTTGLATPIAGLLPSGNRLFVATFDGAIRAYTASPAAVPPDPQAGCGAAAWVAICLAALAGSRSRDAIADVRAARPHRRNFDRCGRCSPIRSQVAGPIQNAPGRVWGDVPA